MTAPASPRTMSLNPYEWRQLVTAGAQGVAAWANMLQTELPSQAEVTAMHAALDRLKLQVSAWGISGARPVLPGGSAVAATAPQNGAKPKKRGGWPKGRKRGPRKPQGVEARQ